MSVHDVIIVGSGAAGTFAAFALRSQRPVLLDLGLQPPSADSLNRPLYEYRRTQDPFSGVIGEEFESLHNIEHDELTPKVKAPLMRYVVERPEFARVMHTANARAVASYAAGGLANAWGAQVYRFDNEDLRNYPFESAVLQPYYDEVEREIGVSGEPNDLGRFHGPASDLLPPLRLGTLARDMLRRYERRRSFFHRHGIFLGKPRLAVRSVPHRDRKAYQYENLEFFKPRTAGIYTPLDTLDSLVAQGAVDYRRGWFVERYVERENWVELYAVHDRTRERQTFRASTVILCLGALNTPRLVLASHNDTTTRLPILDNPMSLTPLVSLRHVGSPLDEGAHSAQLGLFCRDDETGELAVGMIYALDGVLRSDLLFEFPLDARGCLSAARYLLPAMTTLQVFRASAPQPGNYIALDSSGALVFAMQRHPVSTIEGQLLRAFRAIGYLGHSRLVRFSPPGASIHYGGALPMRTNPTSRYETSADGLLHGSRRVFVGDSSSFPTLPAKNLTLTIMSNAMRVASAAAARSTRVS